MAQVKTPNLDAYIEQRNRMARIFQRDPIDRTALNAKMANELFESLDGELSPENLCCDGELCGAALQKKAKMLRGAAADLNKLGFQPANKTWNI